MTVYVSTCIGIRESTDLASAEMSGSIPIIEFPAKGNRAYIGLHFENPVEQVDWLRHLAAQCEALAVEIAMKHGAPVEAVQS